MVRIWVHTPSLGEKGRERGDFWKGTWHFGKISGPLGESMGDEIVCDKVWVWCWVLSEKRRSELLWGSRIEFCFGAGTGFPELRCLQFRRICIRHWYILGWDTLILFCCSLINNLLTCQPTVLECWGLSIYCLELTAFWGGHSNSRLAWLMTELSDSSVSLCVVSVGLYLCLSCAGCRLAFCPFLICPSGIYLCRHLLWTSVHFCFPWPFPSSHTLGWICPWNVSGAPLTDVPGIFKHLY